MKLTPIRVRGKRRLPEEGAEGEGAKRSKAQALDREALASAARARLKARKSSKFKMALILRVLPLEVLEDIFLLSENVNFATSSPLLGCRLSARVTLVNFVTAAFAPTWEQFFAVELVTYRSYNGWFRDFDRLPGNASFQTDILGCKWATIDVILEAKDRWARSNSKGPYTVAVNSTPRSQNLVQAQFDMDFANLSHEPAKFWRRRSQEPPSSFFDVHPKAKLPANLLDGNWTREKIKRLWFLFESGISLAPSQTWEVTVESFFSVFSLQPFEVFIVIQTFQGLGIFATWPRHELDRAVQTYTERSGPWKENEQDWPFLSHGRNILKSELELSRRVEQPLGVIFP